MKSVIDLADYSQFLIIIFIYKKHLGMNSLVSWDPNLVRSHDSNPSSENSRGSFEFPNQNLRQIVHGFLSFEGTATSLKYWRKVNTSRNIFCFVKWKVSLSKLISLRNFCRQLWFSNPNIVATQMLYTLDMSNPEFC